MPRRPLPPATSPLQGIPLPPGNPDDWDRVMRVNALAPMRLIRALAPKMCDKGEVRLAAGLGVAEEHEGHGGAAAARLPRPANRHPPPGLALPAPCLQGWIINISDVEVRTI